MRNISDRLAKASVFDQREICFYIKRLFASRPSEWTFILDYGQEWMRLRNLKRSIELSFPIAEYYTPHIRIYYFHPDNEDDVEADPISFVLSDKAILDRMYIAIDRLRRHPDVEDVGAQFLIARLREEVPEAELKPRDEKNVRVIQDLKWRVLIQAATNLTATESGRVEPQP